MRNKIPLIFLHGALGSSKQFDSISVKLQSEYNVHVLDFDGHGGFPIPDDSFSLKMFRSNVLKYMDENEIISANIFGYSMGGYVALSLAAECPERIESIMTLATKFDWTVSTASAELKMLDSSNIKLKVPQLAETLKQRHSPENWENVVRKTGEFIIFLSKSPLSENDFRKVKCKIRIMVGDRDKMVSVHESFNVYKMIASGSFSVLPNTPHPFEAVDENRLIYELKSFFI